MFTIDDFWKIFRVIKGETVTDIADNIKTLSKDELAIARKLFKDNIDQNCYYTDDYKRLKEFIVNWYATHKTVSSIQKEASDPFSLPDEHLDELFRSFGYNFSTELSLYNYETNQTKVNFFLDLVNLYKIKGTPRSIIEALQYYNLNPVEIIEYRLIENLVEELVFRGESVYSSTGSPLNASIIDVSFDIMTGSDPHWMLSESKIEELRLINKINLPSKTPYFSIRTQSDLSELEAVIAALMYNVENQYASWKSTGNVPTRDTEITQFGYKGSLLEIYLSCVYLFNDKYPTGVSGNRYLSYDGTASTSIQIINEYNDLISNPATRQIRESNLILFRNTFTKSSSNKFLKNLDSAGNILQELRPSLKTDLDSVLDTTTDDKVLSRFLRDLQRWIQINIGSGYPNLAYFVLAYSLTDDIKNVIDFFKPYRSRLSSADLIYVINNPLMDSIRISDNEDPLIPVELIYDYITANSHPCCPYPTLLCSDSTSVDLYYSRNTYDCGSFYDLGACIDNNTPDITITQDLHDYLICRDASILNTEYIQNGYGYDSTGNITMEFQSGGFVDFDEGGSFDCPYGSDVMQIYIQD